MTQGLESLQTEARYHSISSLQMIHLIKEGMWNNQVVQPHVAANDTQNVVRRSSIAFFASVVTTSRAVIRSGGRAGKWVADRVS